MDLTGVFFLHINEKDKVFFIILFFCFAVRLVYIAPHWKYNFSQNKQKNRYL